MDLLPHVDLPKAKSVGLSGSWVAVDHSLVSFIVTHVHAEVIDL